MEEDAEPSDRLNPGTHRLWMAAALVVVSIAIPVVGANAGVVSPCSFAAGTVSVPLSNGESATLERSGTAIAVNGTACETATVLNTDLIAVSSTDGFDILTIDLSGGPFAPGVAEEGDGSSEIEIDVVSGDLSGGVSIIGTELADHVVVDDLTNTGNLNADEATPDDDLTMEERIDLSIIDVRGGDDILETAHTSAHLIGGDGDDLFRNTDDGDVQVDGVGGRDVATYVGNTGRIQVIGDGLSAVVGDPRGAFQQLSSIETVRTTNLNDEISVGDGIGVYALAGEDRVDVFEGTNVVYGGSGRDLVTFRQATPVLVRLEDGSGRGDGTRTHFVGFEEITGTGSDDLFVAARSDYLLDGGDGLDTYSLANASGSVRVALGTGFVSNGDRLDAIEAVVGSSFDDRIGGSYITNVLAGRGGNDVIRGLAADDRLLGGHGDDLLDGGAGSDSCHGGSGTDHLVSC